MLGGAAGRWAERRSLLPQVASGGRQTLQLAAPQHAPTSTDAGQSIYAARPLGELASNTGWRGGWHGRAGRCCGLPREGVAASLHAAAWP
jgi:hypothetical protein